MMHHENLLLQELIEGREITVAVLLGAALPVVEIIAPEGKEFDYDNKYNGTTKELCPPENVSEETQQKAQKLAFDIHKLTECRDMSRTDMIITKDDDLYVLETNTIPGLTAQSLLPKAANTAGISMIALCSKLVEAVLARK
jgi:D-alanine-D-alanine ligase